MTTVHYKGRKDRFPVDFPIGVKSKTSIEKTLFAEPYLEMEDEDAKKLVAIDSHNFEIVPEAEKKALSAGLIEMPAKKKSGRKAKA